MSAMHGRQVDSDDLFSARSRDIEFDEYDEEYSDDELELEDELDEEEKDEREEDEEDEDDEDEEEGWAEEVEEYEAEDGYADMSRRRRREWE